MNRLFEQHYIRQVQDLDGMWKFKNEVMTGTLPVPGCWEQHPKLMAYRGHGRYEREVNVCREGNVRFVFKGVSHTADVYLDGEKIAHHYNAFTPFSVVVKNAAKGMHTLSVDVDNSFGEASALHIPNDYYTYGGITRPVSMELLPNAYIKYLHFTPYEENGEWHGKCVVAVENIAEKMTASLRLEFENRCIERELTLEKGENTIMLDEVFAGVKTWSNAEPNLYLIRAVLNVDGTDTDDLTERIGFRTVTVDGTKIKLNGKEIYLVGFNRHEDHADTGCAMPLQQMAQDLDLMQDMNANAVRTCHYPNDERFLDLCDERGIFVWEENHARGLKLEDMQNPNFERQCADCIAEMIENHYNHPSIIIWGILNECASETEEGREMYKKQYEQIKAADSSRPTTSATCRHFRDISLDLPDVVSFNMYSGWYKDCPIDERNEQEIEWIKQSGGDNKPIIVSELGAAAIYGYRDRARCKWSEERQADIIRENLEVYMNDSDITGVFIWQFADCRVTEEGEWFATRARCHNNKGIVDEYRRPKMAYDTIKEMFKKKN